MSTDPQNLYEVIELSRDASRDLIAERCIRLGERYRPDKNIGDLRAALKFAQIENAYRILIDPVRRAAYDEELRSKEIAQDHVAASGTVGAQSAPASTGAATSGEDISLHSKINSWVALLFLLVVFKVLSDLLSKLAAEWFQTNNFDPMNVAMIGAAVGVFAAFVVAFMFGRLLGGIIPLRPPLSGILRTRGRAEIAMGKRILATVALLILAPVVLVGGFIAIDSQKKEAARVVAEKRDVTAKDDAAQNATPNNEALVRENNRKFAYLTCKVAAAKDYDTDWATACESVARNKQILLRNCLATQDYYDQLKWEQRCRDTYSVIDPSPECTLPQARADPIERRNKEAKDRCLNEANSGL